MPRFAPCINRDSEAPLRATSLYAIQCYLFPAGVCFNPPAPFLKGEPTGRILFRPKFYVASRRVASRLPLCKGGQGGFRRPASRYVLTRIQRPASRYVLTRIPKPHLTLMFLLRKLLHNPLNHHLSISSHITILNPNHRQTNGLHLPVPFDVPCLCLGCEM